MVVFQYPSGADGRHSPQRCHNVGDTVAIIIHKTSSRIVHDARLRRRQELDKWLSKRAMRQIVVQNKKGHQAVKYQIIALVLESLQDCLKSCNINSSEILGLAGKWMTNRFGDLNLLGSWHSLSLHQDRMSRVLLGLGAWICFVCIMLIKLTLKYLVLNCRLS